MAVTDISEVRKKREARRTRNLIIRIFVVLLICGTVLVAVFTKDMWFPAFSGMVTSIPENISSDQSSAELAEGRFPIIVEGGMGYQLMNMDGALALLDDSSFHVYGTDGRVLNEKHHTYANPILFAMGTKALIYDEGGRDFSLEGKYKTVYSKTADDVIYLATLSRNDYVAVVTKSDKFLAMLKVYDPRGDVIFTYYSYDSRIIDITFTNSGTGCLITALNAEGGQFISRMIRFDFTDTEPKWISEGVEAVALDTAFTNDGNIIMIGDNLAAGFSSDGELLSKYEYSDRPVDFHISDKASAVLTENSDLRKYELVMFSGADCAQPYVTVLGDASGKVFVDGKDFYILRSGGIDVYDINGAKIGEITLEDDYDDLCKSGKYVYLLGYDSINRIEYSG